MNTYIHFKFSLSTAPRCPASIPNGDIQEDGTCVRGIGQQCGFNCSAQYRPTHTGKLTCTEQLDNDGNPTWDVQNPCEGILSKSLTVYTKA